MRSAVEEAVRAADVAQRKRLATEFPEGPPSVPPRFEGLSSFSKGECKGIGNGTHYHCTFRMGVRDERGRETSREARGVFFVDALGSWRFDPR
jgi:hypothetical protein